MGNEQTASYKKAIRNAPAGASCAHLIEWLAIQYSMLIEWSDEDLAYLVTLPEWTQQVYMPVTHGDTYEEAVKNGREVLEILINDAKRNDEPLPQPKIYAA